MNLNKCNCPACVRIREISKTATPDAKSQMLARVDAMLAEAICEATKQSAYRLAVPQPKPPGDGVQTNNGGTNGKV